jgi:hypothetical protein
VTPGAFGGASAKKKRTRAEMRVNRHYRTAMRRRQPGAVGQTFVPALPFSRHRVKLALHGRPFRLASGLNACLLPREDTMKIAPILLMLILALILASCVPIMSLRQWYTDPQLVLEPGFAGDWYAMDDGKVDESWIISIVQDLDKGYTLAVPEDKHPDVSDTYEIHLFRMGVQLYADECEGKSKWKGEELSAGVFMIQGHAVGKVTLSGDDLRMDFLDDDYVKDALKANPKVVRYETLGDTTILTASVEELQQFLKSATGPKAFSFHVGLRRKKPQ